MDLTTTSYAILGHLALQPWTPYGLADQFRKNLRYYFPRAESQLYAEPKRLVRLGLATARRETIGNRPRTTYEITPKGREALAAWLAAPPTARGPVMEFEAVLRVMLAPLGDDAHLLAVLRGVRDDIRVMLETAVEIGAEYDRGEAPFQRFIVHRSIMHDFLCSFADLVDAWAARSIQRVERWPSMTPEEREAEALELYRTLPRRRPGTVKGGGPRGPQRRGAVRGRQEPAMEPDARERAKRDT